MITYHYCEKCKQRFDGAEECLRHEELCGQETKAVVRWTLDINDFTLHSGKAFEERLDKLRIYNLGSPCKFDEDRQQFKVWTLAGDPFPGIRALIKKAREYIADELDEAQEAMQE